MTRFPGLYILRDGEPVETDDIEEWGRWKWDPANFTVAKTQVGEAEVSTVFLGLDHQHGVGPPVLWETMVFCAPDGDERQRRYSSREAAERGHAEVVAEIRELLS